MQNTVAVDGINFPMFFQKDGLVIVLRTKMLITYSDRQGFVSYLVRSLFTNFNN